METTEFGDKERQVIERIAQQRGLSFEQAAQQLVQEGLAIRVRRGTGRSPARVYDMRRSDR